MVGKGVGICTVVLLQESELRYTRLLDKTCMVELSTWDAHIWHAAMAHRWTSNPFFVLVVVVLGLKELQLPLAVAVECLWSSTMVLPEGL